MLRVHTVLYEGVEPQDFIGPITALEIPDDVECGYVSVDGPGTVTTSAGFDIAIRDSWSPAEADVILVPGGGYGEGSAVDREARRGPIWRAA